MASRVYAVDLGAWSVKIAIATPGLRGTSLPNIVERVVPPGDDARELRACRTLATMVDELRLSDEIGYLGVSGDNVFTQVVEFGFKNLRRSELDKAVGGELEERRAGRSRRHGVRVRADSAAPIGAVEPGEQVRGRVAPPSVGMRVLTYAMRKSRAEELIQLAKLGGFEPRGILPAGGGAAKLVERVPSLAQARLDGPVAVIDIGHERSDVVVVHGGKAVFSRAIARAGKQVDRGDRAALAARLREAEEAKHRDGFIASTSEPATTEAWKRIHDVLVQELAPFARDVRQTLAACRARTGFQPIAALLVGGGSRLRGFGIVHDRAARRSVVAAHRRTTSPRSPGFSLATASGEPADRERRADDRHGVRLRRRPAAVRPALRRARGEGRPVVPARQARAARAPACSRSSRSRRCRRTRTSIGCARSRRVLDQRLADETTRVLRLAENGRRGARHVRRPAAPAVPDSPMPRMSAYDILLEINSHIPTKDKITLDVEKLVDRQQKIETRRHREVAPRKSIRSSAS